VTPLTTETLGVAVRSGATPPARRPFPIGTTVVGVVLLAAGSVLLWSAVAAATTQGADRSLRGPWIAPVAVATAWIALSLAYLVRQLVDWRKPPAGGAEPSASDGDRVRWTALGLHIAAITGFAMLLKPLGFVLAGAAFMIVSMRIFGSAWPRYLLRDVVVAVLLPLAIYLVVKEVLGVSLIQGVLHLNLRQGELYLLPPVWEWPW